MENIINDVRVSFCFRCCALKIAKKQKNPLENTSPSDKVSVRGKR